MDGNIELTNWMIFNIPGTVWKYATLNVIQLNGPALGWFGGAGFGGALFRLGSTVTTVSDIIFYCLVFASLQFSHEWTSKILEFNLYQKKNS